MANCTVPANRSYSALHPAMLRERTSFWSRHDPVMMQLGSTDHWAKMRTRAELLGQPQTSHMSQRAKQYPPGAADPKASGSPEFTARMKQLQSNGDGRVDPKGVAVFSEVPVRDFHGGVPGDHTVVRPKTSPNRSLLRTSYNEKAREGLKYWYQERPKPTSFGRYGIGSYKTVLGLGNGPRS